MVEMLTKHMVTNTRNETKIKKKNKGKKIRNASEL